MDEREISIEIRSAVKDGDVERVLHLIGDSKARLNQMTPFGTWLHIAAKAGRLEVVQCLIDLGADVNAKGGTFGASPLNLAASYGQIETAHALLEAGAELDVSEPERNPLFSAIQGGHLELVKLLIQYSIDSRVRYTGESMKDMDALAFARERGQIEIADYLAALQDPFIG